MVPHNAKITIVLPIIDPLILQAKILAYTNGMHTMDITSFVYVNPTAKDNTKKNADR